VTNIRILGASAKSWTRSFVVSRFSIEQSLYADEVSCGNQIERRKTEKTVFRRRKTFYRDRDESFMRLFSIHLFLVPFSVLCFRCRAGGKNESVSLQLQEKKEVASFQH
jgi:hypothetical protein